MDDVREEMTGATSDVGAKPRIAVLGGGPAGLGAAWKLAKEKKAAVDLFEAGPRLGGNASSFDVDGVNCDFGSHRLHPASDPEILTDIKSLLGDDLLLRPRHGRIRLKGSWIHFPLKPFDLATRLPPFFSAALVFDAATAKLRAPRVEQETFGSVMLAGLGRAMCDNFYFPYMKKLWGLAPDELAPTLAKRRVSGSTLPKLMRKIFAALPGLKSPTTGKFYYPRGGFGVICDRIGAAANASGATIRLNSRVEGVEIVGNRVRSISVRSGDTVRQTPVDAVWSTLPLTTLVKAAGDAPPRDVREAADSIRYRGMILVYIELDIDQYTEFDAHYFPELSIPISRLSEPKNYSAATEPKGVTILCAELPSDPGDQYWSMSDDELGKALYGWLGECGLPQSAKIKRAFTRRLPFAYPVYDRDYERHFSALDRWISGVDGLLTFGRQGLFAHDNTHHALAMAYGAVDCFDGGAFDAAKWKSYREEFLTHVVED
ncbi:MAG: NAD(P)/FAD-dependent oxidoreductase [Parvularculaceae bacterium]